jgi:hypothetical protein
LAPVAAARRRVAQPQRRAGLRRREGQVGQRRADGKAENNGALGDGAAM